MEEELPRSPFAISGVSKANGTPAITDSPLAVLSHDASVSQASS